MANSDTSRVPFDPAQQQLGATYAKALLGTSEKAGISDQVLEELDSVVHDVWPNLPRLRGALESPRVPYEAKLRMLDQAFGDKMVRQLLNFLKVVCKHGRMDCLGAIHAAAHRQLDELRGRVAVRVKTATELDEGLRERIRQRLEQALGRQVVIRAEVEPELIGGMVVRVGDTVYDASVVNRLTRLRQQTLVRAEHAIRDAVERFATAETSGEEPSA